MLQGYRRVCKRAQRHASQPSPDLGAVWHGLHRRLRGVPRAGDDHEGVHAHGHGCGRLLAGRTGAYVLQVM